MAGRGRREAAESREGSRPSPVACPAPPLQPKVYLPERSPWSLLSGQPFPANQGVAAGEVDHGEIQGTIVRTVRISGFVAGEMPEPPSPLPYH